MNQDNNGNFNNESTNTISNINTKSSSYETNLQNTNNYSVNNINDSFQPNNNREVIETSKSFNKTLMIKILIVLIVIVGIIAGVGIIKNLNNNEAVSSKNSSLFSSSKLKIKNKGKKTDIQLHDYNMNVDISWMGDFLKPLDINNGPFEDQALTFINKLPGDWEKFKYKLSGDGVDEYFIGQTFINSDYKNNIGGNAKSKNYIQARIGANSNINTADNRVVLTLDYYGSLDDNVEENLEKMLEIGSYALGVDLFSNKELLEGIANLNSKDVIVSLGINCESQKDIFGSVILSAGSQWNLSEDDVKMEIQIGTYYN